MSRRLRVSAQQGTRARRREHSRILLEQIRHARERSTQRRSSPLPPDLLTCLARSSETLDQALRLTIQYGALIDETLICSLRTTAAGSFFSLGPRSVHYLPAVAEYVLLRLVLMHRQLFDPDKNPIEVHFAHRRPTNLDLHRKYFRATLRFECREVGLLFVPSELEQRMPTPDPVLHRVLRPYAQQLLEAVSPEISMAQRVRDLLIELLPAGFPAAHA